MTHRFDLQIVEFAPVPLPDVWTQIVSNAPGGFQLAMYTFLEDVSVVFFARSQLESLLRLLYKLRTPSSKETVLPPTKRFTVASHRLRELPLLGSVFHAHFLTVQGVLDWLDIHGVEKDCDFREWFRESFPPNECRDLPETYWSLLNSVQRTDSIEPDERAKLEEREIVAARWFDVPLPPLRDDRPAYRLQPKASSPRKIALSRKRNDRFSSEQFRKRVRAYEESYQKQIASRSTLVAQ